MSKIITAKELRDAAVLFKNFDIVKSLEFYESLENKYKPVMGKYFNKNSFNTRKPEKGMQPNLMKKFLNLTGDIILDTLNLYSETDEVNILEILYNKHQFQEAAAKIVAIHVGRNIPASLYLPIAKELILKVGEGNELVEEILNVIGKYLIEAEEKQYNELKVKYSIESFEDHRVEIKIANTDGDTARIKFYRLNEQEVTPHKHGQIITVKAEKKYSEFTVTKNGHDEGGYYYECLIKQNPNGYVTNYLFNPENQFVKAYPSYIESYKVKNKDLVLISGGSGESHSISLIYSMIEKNEFPPNICVVHSTKNKESDTFELDAAIKQLIDKAPDIRISYDKYYTRDNNNNNKGNNNIHYHYGRMTKESLSKNLDNKYDNNYEICVSTSFSVSIQQILKEWGVADDNIHIEGFGLLPEVIDSSLIGHITNLSE